MHVTVLDMLYATQAWIADEKRWCRGYYGYYPGMAKDMGSCFPGVTKWCLAGALARAGGYLCRQVDYFRARKLERAAWVAVERQVQWRARGASIMSFNDSCGHAAVMDILALAIAREKVREC
jgi:hypothetical protein